MRVTCAWKFSRHDWIDRAIYTAELAYAAQAVRSADGAANGIICQADIKESWMRTAQIFLTKDREKDLRGSSLVSRG
jgi:hypothetical protein